jgi:hypothetical protein
VWLTDKGKKSYSQQASSRSKSFWHYLYLYAVSEVQNVDCFILIGAEFMHTKKALFVEIIEGLCYVLRPWPHFSSLLVGQGLDTEPKHYRKKKGPELPISGP